MKIILQKSTGQILEAFSGIEPDDETLLKNNSHIEQADLEVKSVTPEEHAVIANKYLKTTSDGYKVFRQTEYPSITDVVVALAEKEEGDSTMWDDVTAKRQAVKTKYKKG